MAKETAVQRVDRILESEGRRGPEMATAKLYSGPMTAPTEAEIRQAIRLQSEAWPDDSPAAHLRDVVEDFGSFMHGPAYAVLDSPDPLDPDEPDSVGDVWGRDLRASEAKALEFYYQEAFERAFSDGRAAIESAFVEAALRFAAEFPDAPRAKVPVPA